MNQFLFLMLYSLVLIQLNNKNGINENRISNSLLKKNNLSLRDETMRKLKKLSLPAYSNLVAHIDKRNFNNNKEQIAQSSLDKSAKSGQPCNRLTLFNYLLKPSYLRCLMELNKNNRIMSQKKTRPALKAKKPKLATTTRRILVRF